MRNKLLFVLMFFGIQSFGQQGYLYLRHFDVPLPTGQYYFNDLTVDNQNRLLVAHRGGVLQFDGKIWDKIITESTPYQFLKIEDSTYVLTKNNISILREDVFKRNVLESVFSNPWSIAGSDLIKHQEDLYYLIGQEIYRLKADSYQVDTVFKSKLGFEDIFSFQERLYAFEGNYLLEYVGGTWVDLNMYVPEKSDFIFSCQTDSRVFFAYDNGDFFIFDGKELERYSKPLTQYLKENYPVSGKVIGDKLLVASISGGAVVVNILDGSIDYTIQYHNGLPADEVKAITIDKQGGIWLAHNAGLSRAIPELPIKEFQHYPGLKGLPSAVHQSNDTLWVGTSEGLFFLEAIKDYEQLTKVLSRRVLIAKKANSKKEEGNLFEELIDNIFEEEDHDMDAYVEERLKTFKDRLKKEGFRFKNLRDRLQEKEAQLRDSIIQSNTLKSTRRQVQNQYKTVKKVVNVSKLKSIKYQFTEIEGIERKIIKIVAVKQGFFVLASDGLYLVKEGKAKKLWSKLFMNGMQYDKERDLLWLYGAEGVFHLSLSNQSTLGNVDNNISGIAVSDLIYDKGHLIICNTNELRRYSINSDYSLKSEQVIAIDNPFSQSVLVFESKNNIRLLKNDGLYEYNGNTNQLSLIDNYKNESLSYLKDNLGQVWLSTANDWKILNKDTEGVGYTWLRILPNMTSVQSTGQKYMYFISAGMIMRLDTENEYNPKGGNSFIRGAYQASSELFDGKDIKLTHNNNTLKISLSTPEYLFPEGVRYQYYVKGLRDEWSEWSGATEIEFPFIPTGDYTLLIRSKTGIYGDENELEFEFKVLPPYWKTWWFYLLEIAFFSVLILVIQGLNRSGRDNYLTKVISFLTLILFIEFLATVLENNLEGYVGESPVYGFVLNVILALSIIPLEREMNKLLLIFKNKKSDGKTEIDKGEKIIE